MEQLEQKIKLSLDESANALDVNTCRELANRRRLALNSSKTSWFNMRYFVPISALTFCMMLGIFYVQNPIFFNKENPENIANIQAQQSDEQVAMLELLTNTEELEAMSDPYFLVWLSEEREAQTARQVLENAV